ncbi:T9SS type A sorting domain-containing protein [Ferruginibacter sp.]
MAFIRNCFFTAVMVFCISVNTSAQTIYYPDRSSQLLKATAEDAAMLLQKAIPGSKFNTAAYTSNPLSGIILIYDTSITDNQACKTQSDGSSYIKFTAAGDNGLHYGIYQYLYQRGFRFYQPGSIWEVTPVLASAYKKMDTVYTCSYKYKTWFISGGHNRWIMDNNSAYGWDTYFGDNGHNWALYQRRNGMLGSSIFKGHRDDVMTGTYLTTLQNNPCYVANYNGSRVAGSQSVPDIFNNSAKELWANTLEQKYTQYQTTIFGNTNLYTNIYRNYRYNNDYIGIEVPDGAKWGNSKDNDVCSAVDYPSESDQHFSLANATVQKIAAKYPGKRFQLYAYSGHADVPSASIAINNNIDIQLIPTVYQMESSTNGLRNRWYNRSKNVSEYQYLNLSGWSGETPSFKWDDLKTTLQIAKDKKTQGVMWEASPAKFGSLPFLLASNSYLKDNIEVDSTLHEFCNNMFGAAANTIYQLFQLWGGEETGADKYTMQIYLQLLHTAAQQTANAPDVVKERLRELKAYLHYMVLYFDMANDDQNKTITKADKDAAICMYLAKTNKMQLVNSYYIIANLVGKYATTSDFYVKYNVVNGTAYANGNLPLITAAEIDQYFLQDVSLYANQFDQFKQLEATAVKSQFTKAAVAPLATINTKLLYTNGINYYNKTSYNIIASAAGSFSIKYTPTFEMQGKGYINFEVEVAGTSLQVVKDFTIDNNSKAGTLKVDLPKAGNYVLTIVSKYKSSVELAITTNGNYFYKNGAFLGNKTESYRSDLNSLPGYFYIPEAVSKVYCNVNSFSGGKYASAETISKSFDLKDNNGKSVQLRFVTPKDSSLMVLEIPEGAGGTFWQAANMAQYTLQFITISNQLWYAQRVLTSKPSQHVEESTAPKGTAAVFPNPSTGIFNCAKNGSPVKASQVVVYNTQGNVVGSFTDATQFNISKLAAGMYLYRMVVDKEVFDGKIVKL